MTLGSLIGVSRGDKVRVGTGAAVDKRYERAWIQIPIIAKKLVRSRPGLARGLAGSGCAARQKGRRGRAATERGASRNERAIPGSGLDRGSVG